MMRLTLSAFALLVLCSCSGATGAPESAWDKLREKGKQSSEPAAKSRWLLAELLSPGGKATEAKQARAELDRLKAETAEAHFARGLDDMVHAHPEQAAHEMLLASVAYAEQTPPTGEARLLSWFSAQKAFELSDHLRHFDDTHAADVDRMLADPENLGFRGYATFVQLWARREGRAARSGWQQAISAKLGCAKTLRFAGPFGLNRDADLLRSYSAELPGAWPKRFARYADRGAIPEVQSAKMSGCDAVAEHSGRPGVYYAEAFVDLPSESEVLLIAGGALRIWVDDHLIMDRDPRSWGAWLRSGVRTHLSAGRHRVLWKLAEGETSLRILEPNGRPLPVQVGTTIGSGYALTPPTLGPDPNDLVPLVAHPTQASNLLSFVAASLADHDGAHDVATVLLDPLVSVPQNSTGIALMTAAGFIEGDPIFDGSQTRDLMHELHSMAAERDPELWFSRFSNVLWDAEQRGKDVAVPNLQSLTETFPEIPIIGFSLASFYEELDWGAEWSKTVEHLLKKFPDEPDAITSAIDLAESRGDRSLTESLLAHLKEVSPDTEVLFSRAVRRRDFASARKELEQLLARRPERKDIGARIDRLLLQAGDNSRLLESLEAAVKKEPRDSHSRLALADARLAAGEKDALARALVDAIERGAEPTVIAEAIDLLEGQSVLEPYRLDARKVIAEYEASGTHQPGTSARVLDYGAVFLRSDGSHEFLEHEVIRLQSEEGIRQFAEMDAGGHLLHLRVLKKDGRILEPEEVHGKPTATMPHLEVGDYIEMERLLSSWGDGTGETYQGPTWYFREADIAYARSEFLVIAPADLKLSVESHNGAPTPTVTNSGGFVVRRYRLDNSPAAVLEPQGPPPAELLPKVSLAWGLHFANRLSDAAAAMVPLVPIDPRVAKIARRIVEKVPATDELGRAKALYYWILENVQEGEQSDGRQVVVSRNGNRARGFETLCRSIGIPTRWVLSESKIASPIRGERGAYERPLYPLLAIGEKPTALLTIGDKFTPFGTIPSHLRGSRAYWLDPKGPKPITVPDEGPTDSIRYEGKGSINPDGSAHLQLSIIFSGSYGTGLRDGLSQIPENQLPGIIESQMIGQFLEGARLLEHRVRETANLDRPLIIEVEVDVPHFATLTGDALLLLPPFMPRTSRLTTLAERRSALVIGDTVEQSVALDLNLPAGYQARVSNDQGQFGPSHFEMHDAVRKGQTGAAELHLERRVLTGSGRTQPEDYPDFQVYTRRADSALSRAIRIHR
jgi:cellulose synthase operon protein C